MESRTGGPAAAAYLAVHTSKLTKRFGSYAAVSHLDLQIAYGRIFGLLGPNGAGKSTTIKMLITLLPPTSGTAAVAGFGVADSPLEVRRRIGYVSQMLSADGALTGYENLLLSSRLYGMPRREREGAIKKALKFIDLDEQASKLVKAYSGGMIRRLEIAQALLHRPAVLILDEPTIGLDPMARHAVWERLKALNKEMGMTILITTHDMEEADELCDELVILHRGKKVVSGRPEELKAALGADATLDDVFSRACGAVIQESGDFRSVNQTRRTARRLG
jgi:ABC-2 type transport system ATP-binding protein